MIRLIKRYGSRKLYDTEESRYVSLEEIGAWVRQGQEIRVIDNQTSEDVTAQTLTQVILDEGRKGTSFPPSELLHELIRRGEGIVGKGVDSLQQGVDKFLQASVDRLGPVKKMREETDLLRRRLEELEKALSQIDTRPKAEAEPAREASKETVPPSGTDTEPTDR
jgi:polyhydroxyalkanoate synthesis repressor PhaR